MTEEEESIEHLCRRIRALGRDEIAEVGQLPAGVHLRWQQLGSTKMVITGPQWKHILDRHAEMDMLLPELINTLRNPDEIYGDGDRDDGATFWKALDAGGEHWIRATVSIAIVEKGGGVDNSVITARKSRHRGYLRDARTEKKIW